ncbi:hypothetical protein IMCC14465_10060 [alpha proteobacterium IMCC14465]|uniref:Uncharacterized protein n=1 Tax=alpha proteobacterium IMCC14465 TaxID=1220535 RepID=J9A4D4_9PROT|nr:hypothetical protein IMCC14465_10060 [alpha proteobacterium IMCC14465]
MIINNLPIDKRKYPTAGAGYAVIHCHVMTKCDVSFFKSEK